MLTADLHTHTRRSDGVYEPAELIRLARAAGLACLALTDHDTLAGVAEAHAAGVETGVRVIPGVELSVRDVDPASGQCLDGHLLGFFVDPAAASLEAYLQELQEGRVQVARETVAILARLGMPVSWERVTELAAGAVVTRPHVARAMVERGYVAHEREAFDLYLGNGKPAAPERPVPSPARAIRAVRNAGGIVGLAHPVFGQERDWAEQLERLPARLDRLAAEGLVALECHYPDATPAITRQLRVWAHERGLIPTGGSDYHGPDKSPLAPLGHSAVGLEVVEALERARDLRCRGDVAP